MIAEIEKYIKIQNNIDVLKIMRILQNFQDPDENDNALK